MLDTVKTRNIHTWFWLHSSNSNVQVNKSPKSQMKMCTRGGWNGTDARKGLFVWPDVRNIDTETEKRPSANLHPHCMATAHFCIWALQNECGSPVNTLTLELGELCWVHR